VNSLVSDFGSLPVLDRLDNNFFLPKASPARNPPHNHSLRPFGKRAGQDALCRFIFFLVCFVSLYTLSLGGTMARKTRAAAEIVMGSQPGRTPLVEAKPAGRDLVKGQYCNRPMSFHLRAGTQKISAIPIQGEG
jgi:hypothetical protein